MERQPPTSFPVAFHSLSFRAGALTLTLKKMEARLTFHATQRLAERTTLSEDDLFGLIHNRRCVIVGIEPYTNRLHKLFYSVTDKSHFVAIQDMANGEVITILPLDYHENLAWKISEKKLRQAVFHVSPALHSALYPAAKIPSVPSIKCNIMLVIHSPGLQAIRENFGSHRFAARPADADEALGDPDFVEKLTNRFRERQIPIVEVEEILLDSKKSDYFLTIPWDTLTEFEDDFKTVDPD